MCAQLAKVLCIYAGVVAFGIGEAGVTINNILQIVSTERELLLAYQPVYLGAGIVLFSIEA